MVVAIVLLAIVLIAGFKPAVGVLGDWREAHLPPPRVVMAAKNLTLTAIDDHGGRAVPPYWTPSPDEVSQAEEQLPAALRETWDRKAHAIPGKLDGYGRQYFGITLAGRRTLVVNAFCNSWGASDLKARVLKVWDGGACFFAGYYDIAAGRFTKIAVNAEG